MDKENVYSNSGEERPENNSRLSISEQTDRFIKQFNKRKNDIEASLLRAESSENIDTATAHLNNINEDFQKLQHYLSDSTMFLPYYSIRVAQESLKKLQDQIFATQNKVLPKKKFAFKNKKVQSLSKDMVDAKKLQLQRKNLDIDFFECGFKDLSNQELEMLPKDVNGKDVGLHGLSHCSIRIAGSANTVHMSHLQKCTILLGPVSTSVFVENCHDCVLVVACQQLRVHSTSRCAVYLHVTSKAIIEDSSSLKFAPYNWDCPDLENNFKLSGLDRQRNNWNDVDDFNWLSKDAHSPNWAVMPDEERVASFH